jgi:hypothetical protein
MHGGPLTLSGSGTNDQTIAIQMRMAPKAPCAFLVGYNTRMDFFFPEQDLRRAAPEETRILTLEAEPYPDAERVRVNIQMTPFQARPHIEVVLTDVNGDEIATSSIVEPMTWKLEFTMHLRGASASPFKLEARLFYPDGPQATPVARVFDVVPAK